MFILFSFHLKETNAFLFWFYSFPLKMRVQTAFWKYQAYRGVEMVFGWIRLKWYGDKMNYQRIKSPSTVMLIKMGKLLLVLCYLFIVNSNFVPSIFVYPIFFGPLWKWDTLNHVIFIFFCFLFVFFLSLSLMQTHQWLFQFSGWLCWSFNIQQSIKWMQWQTFAGSVRNDHTCW